MKKNRLLTLIALASLLAGCGGKKADVKASITSGKDSVASAEKEKTSSLQDIYDKLYTDSSVFNSLITEIAKQELKLSTDTEIQSILAQRRKEYMEDLIENTSYQSTSKTNGVVSLFDEELLVKDLSLKGYDITCNSGYGPTVDGNYQYQGEKLKCDYTDYYDKVVDPQLLQQLLVEHYILNQKTSILDKNKTVKVKYLSISSEDYTLIDNEDVTQKVYTKLAPGEEILYSSSSNYYLAHFAKEKDNPNAEYIKLSSESLYKQYSSQKEKYDFYKLELEALGADAEPEVGNYAKDKTLEDKVTNYRELTLSNFDEYSDKAKYDFYKAKEETTQKENKDTERARVFMLDAIDKLKSGESTLEDIESDWKDVQKTVEEYNYKTYCTENYNSDRSDCINNYTNKGAYTDEVGLKVNLLNIENKEYITESTLTDSSDELNASILAALFSDSVENKLYDMNGKKYLVSPSLAAGVTASEKNILISDSTNSKYYIIEVELIDSELLNTKDAENNDLPAETVASNKALARLGAKYIAENNASIVTEALEYYLGQYQISVHDEVFYNYLKSTYPKIDFDF